ncbi:MAG: hypothetical protein J1F05_01100 [Muribaculaceae bacterium]|nr:hypothetical protein [Muribaculaceae bacterium]
MIAFCILLVFQAEGRRRMTPVNTAATTTQAINETANDTSRINAKRRAASINYVDDRGYTIYVDTITGEEWMDSTLLKHGKKMEQPLLHAISVGVNIWDPVMRAVGQKYGIADAFVELSLYNRFKPVVEVGLGAAKYRPEGGNYTYRSPMSVYFRVGAYYNFLYNSNPDYSFMAGVKYGYSNFKYSIDDVTLNSPYWDESTYFGVEAQHASAGWLELALGLRVKIYGPISAGWTFKYQNFLHQSKASYGEPWYIPGFGSRNSSITGSFSVVYTLGFKEKKKLLEPIDDAIPISNSIENDSIDTLSQSQVFIIEE